MNFKLTLICIMCISLCSFSQRSNLTKADILKEGTVLTYEVFELNQELGFSATKIVEGDKLDDQLKITLFKTENGFQLVDQINKGKSTDGNILKLENLVASETYTSFIDVTLSTGNTATLCLSDKQFGKPVITVVAETEAESFKYVKTETKKLTFSLNGEFINSESNFYNTKKENSVLAKTFAFLDNKDLPIQTHHYFIFDYKKFSGVAFKLISIDTKN